YERASRAEPCKRDARFRSSCAATVAQLGLVTEFSFLDRMSLSKFGVVLGHHNKLLIMLVKQLDLAFGEVLDVDQPIAGSLHRGDNLVKLEMYRQRVLVLRSLNQKHHKKGDNGGARVYHQLPGIRKVKQRSGDSPDDEHSQSDHERAGGSGGFRRLE